MIRPPFPAVLDNTIVSTFKACPRKAQLAYFEHWKPRGISVHLHAGAAFAAGLEGAREAFYVKGQSPDDSVARGVGTLLQHYGDFECPEDSAKSATRMAGALEFYFDQWPLGVDDAVPITLPSGKRGIEFSFVTPLPIDHPVTGEPILYSGRADMVVDFAGGTYIEDDKTATQLGASWAKQWDLRSQFTGYCWAAKEMGVEVDGVLVRGVSILKTKYDKANSLTYRPQWMIDRWLAQLLRDVTFMIDCWETGYFDYDLSESCSHYGGCTFRTVCLSEHALPWLETDFERRIWDPITRTEHLLGDEHG